MDEEKRAFMKKGLLGVLYTLAAAAFAVPVFSFVTFKKVVKRTVRFSMDEQLAPVNFKDNAFLIRGETGHAAFSARCTHLGCSLRYDEVSGRFQCPCHGSVFDRSGKWLSGPAKKDLERVPLEMKEGGDIIVTVML